MTGPALTRRSLLSTIALAGASSAAKLPPADFTPAARKKAAASLLAYFSTTAPQLLRAPEGILKYPSIAPTLPGKEYSTSLWDWDTLWTARGLFQYAALAKDDALHRRIAEHAIGSLLNFLDHQSPEGRIPILLSVKEADPLGTLSPASNPNHRNQAKPVFGQLALLAAKQSANDVSWLAPHFDKLLRFYDSWNAANQTPIGLYVWGDDVAIGNDNDPTTFGRPFFSSANLLLNCLFVADLSASAELALLLKRPADAQRLTAQSKALAEAIRKYCWDPRDSFFYTADVQCMDRRAELIPSVPRGMDMSWHSLPIRIQTFTGFLPLWCGAATPEQAKAMIQTSYLRDDRLRASAGVRSLSSLESMYALDFSSNPSNWLGPVWIIVNYLVWKGLRDYSFDKEANDLADKTIRLLADDLATNGSLNEYYHPDTGHALSHKGFMDWNLLVLEMMG